MTEVEPLETSTNDLQASVVLRPERFMHLASGHSHICTLYPLFRCLSVILAVKVAVSIKISWLLIGLVLASLRYLRAAEL